MADGALEGPRAPLRSLQVSPLQVERRFTGVITRRRRTVCTDAHWINFTVNNCAPQRRRNLPTREVQTYNTGT